MKKTGTRAALFAMVDAQLRSRQPPEAMQTLERLLHEGYSHEDCLRLIASALVAEFDRALREQRPFDNARYAQDLQCLPHAAASADQKR